MITDTSTDVSLFFLTDGGQPPETVVSALEGFLAGAKSSLDVAVYDCALGGSLAERLRAAFQAAAARGVQIRFAYYAGPHRSPVVVPADPQSSAGFAESLGVPVRAITGFRALMHDKYIVRDAGSPAAAVWTGSTNWTSDAWDREENVVLQLPSPDLAGLFRADFDELWERSQVERTGDRSGGQATLSYAGAPLAATVWFSPGGGEAMAHAVAGAITTAQQRIVVASPVLTVGNVLGAIRDVVSNGSVPVRGIYDETQMDEVRSQWGADSRAAWKIEAFNQIVQTANLSGKRSTPYSPTAVHDYMHLKMMVIDDQVFAGSYNFSHSGEENAENLLLLQSAALADRCAQQIDTLIQRYAR
jgi:phosphatidylserine/phosphatidylglycerophosphate/cardiolipin synthase-like enzyme